MPAVATPRGPVVPVRDGRFLIVGGASLVGSATAERLLAGGAAEVTILDSFFQGSREAIAHISDDRRLKLVQGDVMRLPQLVAAAQGMDGVLHLAALMTITMDRDPWAGIDVNVRGTQNVVEACCIAGVGKLVFASSNAVYGYGPGVVGDLVETTPFHSAGAPPAAILYGASKIMGEQLCRDAHLKRGLDYVVVRYSTVYGERQHYRAANALYIIETLDRLEKGERPEVIGDGSEVKHFVNVADVARANLAAFESAATGLAVNISGPRPVTTLELVHLVAEAADKAADVVHVEPAKDKVRLTSGGPWRIDHARAAEAIGWRPEVDMAEGLRRLVAWRRASRG
ncbi:MAG: NAD-dependent epimerase/dehydratase family protein [Hyphomicrobiaceae bacterium]